MAFLWSPTQLAAIAAATFLTYIVISTTYHWYRLRKVPGPFFARISSLYTASITATGQDALVYRELANEYGHLILVGPNLVLTDDLEALRRISGVRSNYVKDGFYKGTIRHPEYDSMFTTMNNAEHDMIKAQLAGPYGGRETLAMEPIVDDLTNLLLQYLRGMCAGTPELSKVVDLAVIVNYFTMDVITRVAFGHEFGFLRTQSDVYGLLAANRAALRKYVMPLTVPWLRDIIRSKRFQRLLGPKPTDTTGVGVVLRYVVINCTGSVRIQADTAIQHSRRSHKPTFRARCTG